MRSIMIRHGALGGAIVASMTCQGWAETGAPAYVVSASPLVENVHPVLTVGDSVGGYRMVGIPDGLGAYSNGDGTFTLMMNHELTQTTGLTRAHGGNGSFVSQWIIEPQIGKDNVSITADVQSGVDKFNTLMDWNDATSAYVSVPSGKLARFCSAYLAGPWDGFDDYFFLTGEENSNTQTMDGLAGGQSYAVIGNTAWGLPRLGRFAHENQVVLPGTGNLTVVIGMEDGSGLDSQIYVTVGTKVPESSDPLERNGLSNGSLYVMKVQGVANEGGFTTVGQAIPFTLEPVDWHLTGAALESASDAAGGCGFVRIEDAEYDPTNYADFYFDTTGGSAPNVNGRLYRMTFSDLNNPLAGGTITMLLSGSEGLISPDNLAINSHGQILINEDANFTIIGRDAGIWLYDIHTANLNFVIEFDSALAQSLDPAYTHGKWETSGIIDATSVIGDGWWIFDIQAHYNPGDVELVEGGQLLFAKLKTEVSAGDATGNGVVDVDDLLKIINNWGRCPVDGICHGDQDADGIDVDVDDLLLVINNWS